MTRDIRIPVPPDGSSADISRVYQPEMSAALGDFYEASTRSEILDPVLVEVVRIRCARVHDCRICKASRSRSAHHAGVDEEMLDQVDRYEASSLPERLKVALRYTDVFVTRPGEVGEELRRQLHAHFSAAELVALSLDIMKFSIQKQLITLGLDTLPGVQTGDGITWFDFDASGQVEFIAAAAEPSS